jgi:CHASE2 domain-containing sensor protein
MTYRKNGMNRRYYDQPIGWGLVIASVFIMFATLRGKHGAGPLIPQLVPVFSAGLAVVWLAILVAYCCWQRAYFNLAMVVGIFVAGYLLGSVGEHFRRKSDIPVTPAIKQVLNERGITRFNYDWTRHKFVLGVGLSSLVLGVKFLRENDSL